MTDETVSAVMRAYQRRCDAIGNANWALVDSMLDDELVCTHSNGHQADKKAYTENIQRRIRFMEPGETKITVFSGGDAALITGPILIRWADQSDSFRVMSTQVLRKVEGVWKLLAFHVCRVA